MQILFEDIKIPQKELDEVVNQNLGKVHALYIKKRRRRIAAGCTAAAVLIAAGLGFCALNPVIASQIPMIGHLFEKVQDKQIYSGDYSKDAQSLTEGNVSESAGMKMTLSEIYCNTEALNVSVLLESAEAFPDSVHDWEQTDKEQTISYIFMDVLHEFDFMPDVIEEPVQLNGEYLDDHTFAGGFRINFNVNELGLVQIPDSFQWKMKVTGIRIASDAAGAGNGWAQLAVDGIWEFGTDVTMDTEKTSVKEINDYGPTGQGIAAVTKTPYEIILEEQTNEEVRTMEGGLQRVILDADGKYIIDKVGMIPIKDHNVSKITVYYFPVSSNEEYMAIQERINQGNEGLEEYIQGISIYQIEIVFDE